ncbi:hypothetical protein F5J12DRAFT_698826, partial [Pisolithus orientalis]|uniref:uncharacterized protein n=1 Tax=Pisolithus orientalis TaxID=936130 RepID=UPI0022253169
FVVRTARAYQTKGVGFRIITPHDDQRALIEHELEELRLISGNEAEHTIISAARTDRFGFLANHRQTNVVLTHCKETMIICTSEPSIWGPAAPILIRQLAIAFGPQSWV